MHERMIGDRDPPGPRQRSPRWPGFVAPGDRDGQDRHAERCGQAERPQPEASHGSVEAAPGLGKDHHRFAGLQQPHRLARRARISRLDLDGKRAQTADEPPEERDRKSTRLNSSHLVISYAVFCLKKKKKKYTIKYTPRETVHPQPMS